MHNSLRKLVRSKLFIFITLLVCSTLFSWGQTKVKLNGQVTDANNSPISDVVVLVKGKQIGTYSDHRGFFSISLPYGPHQLELKCLGYKTKYVDVEIKGEDFLHIKLEENSQMLGGVEVVAKSSERKAKESIFNVNTLNIRSISAKTIDISNIIERSTGINIREDGGVGSDFKLSLSGLTGRSVRYFINGLPLKSLGSGVNISNIPVSLIDRIDIYKGVVPAELGTDALGGAINLITKSNLNSYVNASIGGGSYGTLKTDFSGRFQSSKLSVAILPTLSYIRSNNNYTMKDVEIWNKDTQSFETGNFKRFHDKYRSALAGLEISINKKRWADDAAIGVNYFDSFKEIQTGRSQKIVYGGATKHAKSLNFSARYAKRNLLNNKLHLNTQFSQTFDYTNVVDTVFKAYQWDGTWEPIRRAEMTGYGKSIRNYWRPKTMLRVNTLLEFNPQHSFVFNYLLNALSNRRTDDFDKSFVETKDKLVKHIASVSYNQNLFNERWYNSFFVKEYIYNAEINQDDLSWITGSRDVPSNITKYNTGYGLGSRFTISNLLAIKASYERSIRLPVSYELMGNGVNIYPNFKLNPEKSHNINLGLFGDILSDNTQQLSYEISGFLRDVTDYIYRIQATDNFSQYHNLYNVEVKGIEGEITYKYLDKLDCTLNATYLDERNNTPTLVDGKPDITYRNRMPNRPWFYSNFNIGYNLGNPFNVMDSSLRFDYLFRYTHWYYLTWKAFGRLDTKEIIPTQYSNDVQLTYSWQRAKYNLSLQCTNIFDMKLYDNYMLQKPGRSLFLKFSVFLSK